MKNVYLCFVLLFTSSLFSQVNLKNFEGIWSSNDTDYSMVITYHPSNDKLMIHNFSFVDGSDDRVVESIVERKNNGIITKISNIDGDWKVKADYEFISPVTLLVKFKGEDYNLTSLFRKQVLFDLEESESILESSYEEKYSDLEREHYIQRL